MPGKDIFLFPSELENMSISELEALLQQDFIASDGTTPDTEYIMTITKVIQKKEQEKSDYQPVDTKQAWDEFQNYYNTENGKKYAFTPSMEQYFSKKSQDRNTASKRIANRRQHHRLPWLAAALLVLLISLTCIPVLGYVNVFQMVAHLSYEHFSFVPTSVSNDFESDTTNSSAPQGTTSYETMPEALAYYGINTPVFPNKLAEEYTQTELKIDEYPLSNKIEFFATYEGNNQTVSSSVIKYTASEGGMYERSPGEEPEVYVINGIEYNIFENIERTSVVWRLGNLECSFKGNFSSKEAKNMIDTIY